MKIAFIDRDGTLIFEPPDTQQIDSLEKLRILPGVIEGLKSLIKQDYRLVMVTNQDGLGTPAFPEDAFHVPQQRLIELLKQEGITFYQVLVCPHRPEDDCPCRKPKPGLVRKLIDDGQIDAGSIMIGDRETDQVFAAGIGVTFFSMKTNEVFPRVAMVKRVSTETNVVAGVNLCGKGKYQVETGLNFLNHMLEQFSKHSLIDLTLSAKGDLRIDEHHTVEDIALVLGEALRNALAEKKGIQRYGFLLPMDDTLAEVAIDLGGRPYLVFNAEFKREMVGDLPTELVKHFFRSLADAMKANIHINVRYSENDHHKIEAIFKAFAKAMKMACEKDSRRIDILPSTKDLL